MPAVSLYSYFCQTENVQKVQWLDSLPQHCRDDPDGTLNHIIEDIFIKDTINNSSVYIEGKAYDPSTNGNYLLKGGQCDVGPGSMTSQNIDFQIPMSIYGIYFQTGPEHKGDTIDVLYRPETVIGTITGGVSTNDSTYKVSSSVLDNVQLGLYMVCTDGSTYHDEIGMIIDINRNNSTISTNTVANKSYNTGTYLAVNAYIVKDYPLQLPWMHKICKGVSGSKLMEKGSMIQLRYHNNSNLPKSFRYSYECVY